MHRAARSWHDGELGLCGASYDHSKWFSGFLLFNKNALRQIGYVTFSLEVIVCALDVLLLCPVFLGLDSLYCDLTSGNSFILYYVILKDKSS